METQDLANRRHIRMPVALPMRISTVDPDMDPSTGAPCFEASEVVCGNLSRGGAFLRSAEPPAPGKRLVVEVKAPDGPALDMMGSVVWAKAGSGLGDMAGCGIQWLQPDPREIDVLMDYAALQAGRATGARARSP